MTPVQPIFVLEEMAQIDQLLINVLKSLEPADWAKQTIAPLWKVKDVAAHLLDGSIRGVSLSRDQYFGDPPVHVHSYEDLISYLNRLNADWVQAMRRMSPPLLITFLETANQAYLEHLKTLDPFAKALFSVGWAGEETSLNWFHIAREYTEKWHHQQQIRLAVGKDRELLEPKFYQPLIDTFMRALPHHYRMVEAKDGTVVQFTISNLSSTWYLLRSRSEWKLFSDCELSLHALITIDPRIAWRIFTKGISRTEAQKHISIEGDLELGTHILSMIAIMG